jgi:hypothetical protein
VIVTVVGTGADARDETARLLAEGHHVRLVRDGRPEATGVPGAGALDDHAALLLERAAAKHAALEAQGIRIEEARATATTVALPTVHPRLDVVDDRRVRVFEVDADRRVTHVHLQRADGTGSEETPTEMLVLAADTLTTTRIFLESWRRATGESPRLTGLLHPREVRARFVTPSMIGRPVDERAAGSPRVAITLRERGTDDVRGELLTAEPERLATDVASVPLDIRTSFRLVREARAALGSATLTFPDGPRQGCWVELGTGGLATHWEPPAGDLARRGRAVARLRHALQMLGSRLLSAAAPDAAVGDDWAGTLPATSDERPFTTRGDGSSRDFRGLRISGDAARSLVG